jgi:hypothetical protein
VGELLLSEFGCTVIKSEAVFAVTDAGLTILKLGGAESAFLDFFATQLAVPGWGGEAGDAVKEVSLRFLLRLVLLRLYARGSPHSLHLTEYPVISIRFQE